jgi:hypothetical protein
MHEQKWPQQIWIPRHGQSADNVARDAERSNAILCSSCLRRRTPVEPDRQAALKS